MPDDPLNTNEPPPVLPPPSRRGVTCEFCECQLAPSGEVLRLGEKAKKFRRHDDEIENKNAEIARLTAEVTNLKAEVDRLKGSPQPARSGHRPGGRVQ